MLLRCERTGVPFQVSERELEYCRQHQLPVPSLAPMERWRDMLLFRNRKALFRVECALTGKPLLSVFPPESSFTIADVPVWESDRWDATDWGRPYDFSRGFFEQFFELARLVPLPALSGAASTNENCDYVNGVSQSKDCYLVFGATESQDCLYTQNVNQSRNVIDCTMVSESELCYGCRDVRNCYHLLFSEHCTGCSDSAFLANCQSCRDCYGCVNLSSRRYCVWNEQLTPEEYSRVRSAIALGTSDALEQERRRFAEHRTRFPLRSFIGVRNEDVTGNFLYDSKNCFDCMNCRGGQDLEHCLGINNSNDNFYHLYFGLRSQQIYNCISSGLDIQNLKFCSDIRMGCESLSYCYFCSYGVSQCFGCVGLKRKSYCILNQQYSKEEYLELSARIIQQMKERGEWGRFFPSRYAPHAYNACEAADVLPLTQAEAEQRGYRWAAESAEPGGRAREAGHLPIDEADDAVLSQVFRCRSSGRPFRIIAKELEFLRRERLALPVLSPLERLAERASILRYRPLKERSCASCREPMVTPYDERDRRVLCENCFLDVQ